MTIDNFSYTKISVDDFTGSYVRTNALEMRSGSIAKVDYENIVFYEDGTEKSREKDFVSVLKNQFVFTLPSGLLFPAVRYSIPGFLVFERPPITKMVEYAALPIDNLTEENFEESLRKYNLALPWQLYVAEYDPNTMLLFRVHMYFMKESLKDIDQTMYLAPLPNFYANGHLCRPLLANMDDIERYSKDLSGVMASAYDWIWNSGFNHDLMEGPLTVYHHKNNSLYDAGYLRTPPTAGWQRYMHPKDIMNIFLRWEEYTLDNILSVEWPNLSVCSVWDGEMEWFFENDAEYPYLYDEYLGHEELDSYIEDYPMKVHDLKKSFKIMMRSVFHASHSNAMMVDRFYGFKYHQRFSAYHKLAM
jgi:hypothetical protein